MKPTDTAALRRVAKRLERGGYLSDSVAVAAAADRVDRLEGRFIDLTDFVIMKMHPFSMCTASLSLTIRKRLSEMTWSGTQQFAGEFQALHNLVTNEPRLQENVRYDTGRLLQVI